MSTKTSQQIRRVGRLNSLDRVRIELGRVYTDCRTGRIPAVEGARMASILSIMVRVIELQAIQARLVGLEAQLAARRAPFDAFGAYAEVVLAEAREETKH